MHVLRSLCMCAEWQCWLVCQPCDHDHTARAAPQTRDGKLALLDTALVLCALPPMPPMPMCMAGVSPAFGQGGRSPAASNGTDQVPTLAAPAVHMPCMYRVRVCRACKRARVSTTLQLQRHCALAECCIRRQHHARACNAAPASHMCTPLERHRTRRRRPSGGPASGSAPSVALLPKRAASCGLHLHCFRWAP